MPQKIDSLTQSQIDRIPEWIDKRQQIFNVATTVNNNAQELFESDDLAGCCGICSAVLAATLSKVKIQSIFCYGTFSELNHCWIEVDEFLIDITSRQFNDNNFDVEIHLKDEIYDEGQYDRKFGIKYSSLKNFVKTLHNAIPDWFDSNCHTAPNRKNIMNLLKIIK